LELGPNIGMVEFRFIQIIAQVLFWFELLIKSNSYS